MTDIDTIAAIATAPGRSGIGIVRVSGPASLQIAEHITQRKLVPRVAHYARFHSDFPASNTLIDSGIVLYFPGPGSFTGEDVIEFQGHGSPIVLDMLLQEICHCGARLARPGEFSERAFLNNKLDLSQAEAIADLINSSTQQAALNANRSLQGEFSRKIDSLLQQVTALRVYVEAAIDFPEEEIDFLADGVVASRLSDLREAFNSVLAQAQQGSLISEGMRVVIAGRPNAGKSSLLNALAGQDRAIVTPIAGTTRDVLTEAIQIDGMPLHIVDTAGLRDSADAVEQEGIRRAMLEIETADRILLVVDATTQSLQDLNIDALWPDDARPRAPTPVTIIVNKTDAASLEPRLSTEATIPKIYLSAKTGAGLQLLKDHLKSVMGFNADGQGNFSARRRHLVAIENAIMALEQGMHQLTTTGAGELLAEDLRHCHDSLGEITGAMSTDALLGEIFSSFCIGK